MIRPLCRTASAPRFDRSRLPLPAYYYTAELKRLAGYGEWRQAVCCFHDDHNPSLSVNICTGGFRCFACGAHGGDVLDFQRLRYRQSFPDAARALGAWRGRR